MVYSKQRYYFIEIIHKQLNALTMLYGALRTKLEGTNSLQGQIQSRIGMLITTSKEVREKMCQAERDYVDGLERILAQLENVETRVSVETRRIGLYMSRMSQNLDLSEGQIYLVKQLLTSQTKVLCAASRKVIDLTEKTFDY